MVQTELHRHLDVSLRPATLLELAQARGLEAQSTSLPQFLDKIVLRKPLRDLSEVLATFTLFQKVLDRPEALERVGFEIVEDLWREGTRKAELRFSLSFVSEYSGMSWDDVLTSFEAGIRRGTSKYPEMKVGLLCIASRDFGEEAAAKTVEFFLRNRNRFVGMDLAGNENQYPCRLFEKAFKPLRDAGAKITVHAGEDSGPENIWEAIELLGARRIGHGISAIRDPKLMEKLRNSKICLEMCPTSNWLTQAVPSFESHPLPQVLRAGVPVCINTDDPAVFAVTLPDELRIAREKMGLTEAEIAQCQDWASSCSFI